MALHYVADLDQLEEAKPAVFSVQDRSIGLIRLGDKVRAVRNLCPHKRAPVCQGRLHGTMLPSAPSSFVFGMENQVLQCPWHGWEFDLETGASLCVGKAKLTLYPVTLKERAVYVEL